jgi:hypothetical protein
MCATVSTCFFPAFAHLAHTSSRLLRVLCSGVAHGNMRAMVCNSRLLLLQGTAAFASHLPITSLLSPCLGRKSASHVVVAGKGSFCLLIPSPHSSYHQSGFLISPLAHASPHFRYVDVHNRPPPQPPPPSPPLLSSSSTTPKPTSTSTTSATTTTNDYCSYYCTYYYGCSTNTRCVQTRVCMIMMCVCFVSSYVLAVNTSSLRPSLPPSRSHRQLFSPSPPPPPPLPHFPPDASSSSSLDIAPAVKRAPRARACARLCKD